VPGVNKARDIPLEEIEWHYCRTKKEAEQYAKDKLGKTWRYLSKIETAGWHRRSGWRVRIYRPVQETRA
jgi:hypothetical protein